jgi:uncharacterized protein YraI
MRRYALSLAAGLLATAAMPGLAAAADAVTTVDLNMRAGPATAFPVVEVVPDDAQVTVFGCVSGYQWCDVSWRGARGWVYGPYLSSFYSGRYVPLVEYSAGLPIIDFSVDTYWDSYYRDRPWYGQRARWRYTWRDHRRDFREDRREDRADRRRDRREDRVDRRDDRRDARVDRRRDNRADRRDDRRDARVDRRREDRTDRRDDRPGTAMEGRREGRAERGPERREMRAERGGEPRGNAGRGGEVRERGNAGGSRPGGGERGGGGGRGGREG